MHVAGLQGGRSRGVGGADAVLHDERASGIMGDALHRAHLRAPTAGDGAGVPLPGSPAGEGARGEINTPFCMFIIKVK